MMAKKPKHPRRAEPSRLPANGTGESSTGEVATVVWMLSLLATLIAEIVGILIRLLMLQWSDSSRLRVLSGTLLIVAVLSGLLTLILTPVTLRFRRVPPPQPIVISAVIIGLIPLLTVFLLVFR